jgi:hypothetical protein
VCSVRSVFNGRQHTVHCEGHWTAYSTNRSNKGGVRSAVTTKGSLLCMYMEYWLATFFITKGSSSGNECMKTTKKSYWLVGGLCIDYI